MKIRTMVSSVSSVPRLQRAVVGTDEDCPIDLGVFRNNDAKGCHQRITPPLSESSPLGLSVSWVRRIVPRDFPRVVQSATLLGLTVSCLRPHPFVRPRPGNGVFSRGRPLSGRDVTLKEQTPCYSTGPPQIRLVHPCPSDRNFPSPGPLVGLRL